ncbi:MAG: LamG-like jellyroll fold domain-containing protein [Verrucomicrobiaceae bacterium]
MKQQALLVQSITAIALVSTAQADFSGAVISDSPLAYYRFEEEAGATTLVDSSGNGLDIDFSAPTGTTVIGVDSAMGRGVQFNADGALVTPLMFDPSAGDFTLEAVVRTGDLGVLEGIIFSNQDGSSGPGRSDLLVNLQREFTTYVGGATSFSGIPVTEDGYDLVMLTYDQSAAGSGEPTLRFYVNGVEAGAGTRTAEPANGSWVIGAHKGLASQFFVGVVDDVAFFDKRLDDPDGDGDTADSRISAHYKGFLADAETLVTFESDVPYLDSGDSAALSWLVSPALTSLTLDDGSGPVSVAAQTTDCEGGIPVSPTVTTTYTLEGTGPVGTESLELTVVVNEPAVVNSFTSNFSEIPPGNEITLSWEVTNGTTVEIDQGVGVVDPLSGSVAVLLAETTTYTLTATNSVGSVSSMVTVTALELDDPSLIAHWKVGEAEGETSGTSLISETGEGFIGTFFGFPVFDTSDPAPVPGGSTASIVFDGANSWVDILNYSGIGGGNARTIAFWFKGPATQPNNNATLVSWGGTATGNRFDTRVNGNSSGVIRTEVAGSGSNGSALIADDTWHHCVMVFDPTVGTTVGEVVFYVDGVLDPLSVVGGTEINSSTDVNVRIGASRSIAGRSLTGKMDDIRIYNRALDAADVEALLAPEPEALEITQVRVLSNGNVEVDWKGAPGTYFLEYSLDLTDSNWFEITDNATIETGATSGTAVDDFIAPAPENSKVFYRIRKME